MRKTQINLGIRQELLDRIDNERGFASRPKFIDAALKFAFDRGFNPMEAAK